MCSMCSMCSLSLLPLMTQLPRMTHRVVCVLQRRLLIYVYNSFFPSLLPSFFPSLLPPSLLQRLKVVLDRVSARPRSDAMMRGSQKSTSTDLALLYGGGDGQPGGQVYDRHHALDVRHRGKCVSIILYPVYTLYTIRYTPLLPYMHLYAPVIHVYTPYITSKHPIYTLLFTPYTQTTTRQGTR